MWKQIKSKQKKYDLKFKSTTYLVITAVYYTILQMLHLKLGPNHLFTYSWNLVIDVKDFTLEESRFYIFEPKAIKCLSQYFSDLWRLTNISSSRIKGLQFDTSYNYF